MAVPAAVVTLPIPKSGCLSAIKFLFVTAYSRKTVTVHSIRVCLCACLMACEDFSYYWNDMHREFLYVTRGTDSDALLIQYIHITKQTVLCPGLCLIQL